MKRLIMVMVVVGAFTALMLLPASASAGGHCGSADGGYVCAGGNGYGGGYGGGGSGGISYSYLPPDNEYSYTGGGGSRGGGGGCHYDPDTGYRGTCN